MTQVIKIASHTMQLKSHYKFVFRSRSDSERQTQTWQSKISTAEVFSHSLWI